MCELLEQFVVCPLSNPLEICCKSIVEKLIYVTASTISLFETTVDELNALNCVVHVRFTPSAQMA